MIIPCNSLFNGNASVGSHIVEEAQISRTTIQIKHKGQLMTVDPIEFYRFFSFGKDGGKKYRHTDGRPGFYTLKYIQWKPDEKENGNG